MGGGRNYNVTTRTGKDGAQYVRIREVPPAGSRRAFPSFEHLNVFKHRFQKALRLVSRTGR